MNRLVQQSTADGEGNGGERTAPLGAALTEVDVRLGRLADDAADLVQAADAAEFPDLGRRAESLRAQLLSARKRLRELGSSS